MTTDVNLPQKTKIFKTEGVLNSPHPPAESVAAGQLVKYLLQHRIAEFLQLDHFQSSPLPWIIAGLAPWRGAIYPNPLKKEPKYCASLITKHELMYGEEIRDIIEDIFERGKMDIVKKMAEQNILATITKQEAGISRNFFSDYS